MIYDPKRTSYLADIPYILSGSIVEYDIAKANISILYSEGFISKEEYDYILLFPKLKRHIYIGHKLKNKETMMALENGFAKARKQFLEANDIQDNQLLSVKKDAIFLVNTVPKYTKFGLIEFDKKNEYTTYFRIGKLECYYGYNPVEDREIIDIKGINDDKLPSHIDGMIYFICSVMYNLQSTSVEHTLKYIIDFYNQYLNRQLPLDYYRSFDSNSMFILTDQFGYSFGMNTIDPKHISNLDISVNLNVIRELYGYVSSMYLK